MDSIKEWLASPVPTIAENKSDYQKGYQAGYRNARWDVAAIFSRGEPVKIHEFVMTRVSLAEGFIVPKGCAVISATPHSDPEGLWLEVFLMREKAE